MQLKKYYIICFVIGKNNNSLLVVVLWAQVVADKLQFPEVSQILDLGPDSKYPHLHEKIASVSTGNPPCIVTVV